MEIRAYFNSPHTIKQFPTKLIWMTDFEEYNGDQIYVNGLVPEKYQLLLLITHCLVLTYFIAILMLFAVHTNLKPRI